MHPNAQLIHTFYSAFQRRDASAMAACYHREVEFNDPAFGPLDHAQVSDMWRMLCERGKDLRLEFSDVHADDASGRAHWEARYTFTQTGRAVLNRIEASFSFRDGLIVRHTDTFDFWRWSRQALGAPGLLLGWTPLLRNKVRTQGARALARYSEARAAGR